MVGRKRVESRALDVHEVTGLAVTCKKAVTYMTHVWFIAVCDNVGWARFLLGDDYLSATWGCDLIIRRYLRWNLSLDQLMNV